MPLVVSTFFLPSSGATPFLMEDIHLRGGFRVVADIAERNSIGPAKKKPGMLVHTQVEDVLWKLLPNGTWEVFSSGGGTGTGVDPAGDTMTGALVSRISTTEEPYQDVEFIPQSEVLTLISTSATNQSSRLDALENKGLVYAKEALDTQWLVQHDLGTQDLLLQIRDDSNNIVLPSSTAFVDDDNIVINFAVAKKGRVILTSV